MSSKGSPSKALSELTKEELVSVAQYVVQNVINTTGKPKNLNADEVTKFIQEEEMTGAQLHEMPLIQFQRRAKLSKHVRTSSGAVVKWYRAIKAMKEFSPQIAPAPKSTGSDQDDEKNEPEPSNSATQPNIEANSDTKEDATDGIAHCSAADMVDILKQHFTDDTHAEQPSLSLINLGLMNHKDAIFACLLKENIDEPKIKQMRKPEFTKPMMKKCGDKKINSALGKLFRGLNGFDFTAYRAGNNDGNGVDAATKDESQPALPVIPAQEVVQRQNSDDDAKLDNSALQEPGIFPLQRPLSYVDEDTEKQPKQMPNDAGDDIADPRHAADDNFQSHATPTTAIELSQDNENQQEQRLSQSKKRCTLEECSVEDIVHILSSQYVNTDKLRSYKEKIFECVRQEQLSGAKLKKMKKTDFAKMMANCCGDKVKGAMVKIHMSLTTTGTFEVIVQDAPPALSALADDSKDEALDAADNRLLSLEMCDVADIVHILREHLHTYLEHATVQKHKEKVLECFETNQITGGKCKKTTAGQLAKTVGDYCSDKKIGAQVRQMHRALTRFDFGSTAIFRTSSSNESIVQTPSDANNDDEMITTASRTMSSSETQTLLHYSPGSQHVTQPEPVDSAAQPCATENGSNDVDAAAVIPAQEIQSQSDANNDDNMLIVQTPSQTMSSSTMDTKENNSTGSQNANLDLSLNADPSANANDETKNDCGGGVAKPSKYRNKKKRPKKPKQLMESHPSAINIPNYQKASSFWKKKTASSGKKKDDSSNESIVHSQSDANNDDYIPIGLTPSCTMPLTTTDETQPEPNNTAARPCATINGSNDEETAAVIPAQEIAEAQNSNDDAELDNCDNNSALQEAMSFSLQPLSQVEEDDEKQPKQIQNGADAKTDAPPANTDESKNDASDAITRTSGSNGGIVYSQSDASNNDNMRIVLTSVAADVPIDIDPTTFQHASNEANNTANQTIPLLETVHSSLEPDMLSVDLSLNADPNANVDDEETKNDCGGGVDQTPKRKKKRRKKTKPPMIHRPSAINLNFGNVLANWQNGEKTTAPAKKKDDSSK